MRGRIIDAALALFSELGVDATTVEDICGRADVARKTFYNYYPSKQHLTSEISESLLIGETHSLVTLGLEKYDSTEKRLRFFFQSMQQNMSRYRDLERALILQAMFDTATNASRGGQQLQALNEALEQLVKAGREQGDVREDHSTTFLAEAVTSIINGLVLNWVHDPRYPLARRIRETADLCCELLAPRG